MTEAPFSLLENLVAESLKAGADSADVLSVDSEELSVSLRLGTLESLERAETTEIGLRVFIGQKQAMVSTSDRRPDSLKEVVARAIAMAQLAPEDPFCGLADSSELSRNAPVLDLTDRQDFTPDQLIAQAKEAEEAARAVAGVSNSDGVEAGQSRTRFTLVASNGFTGQFSKTRFSLSASVLAGDGTGMQRDHDYASRVFAADLPTPESIGRKAGERAVRKLNPRKMPTARVPVFYDPRVARGLLSALLDGISGAAIARGTSFLKESLGQKIFPDSITITDDPFRAKGLRSRPFDAEGIAPQKRALVDRGILTTWLLTCRSARHLGLHSTGHAGRSPSGSPHPTPCNVYLEAGDLSPAALMQDVTQGFYVTETMGMGVNQVTGDYSQAASGFWIENGMLAFPVSEVTIAGNLKDMFLNLTAANDLAFERGIDSPTLRVEGMTVAGA